MYKALLTLFLIAAAQCAPTDILSGDQPTANITVHARSVGTQGSIEYKVLKKPHHLFIGRCDPNDRILHQENIILNNDGKSHVFAGIRVNVQAEVYITCVKIYDEIPDGAGGYPSFVAGGVGHNFVEFSVLTDYGKGFHFFVQILGYDSKKKQ